MTRRDIIKMFACWMDETDELYEIGVNDKAVLNRRLELITLMEKIILDMLNENALKNGTTLPRLLENLDADFMDSEADKYEMANVSEFRKKAIYVVED